MRHLNLRKWGNVEIDLCPGDFLRPECCKNSEIMRFYDKFKMNFKSGLNGDQPVPLLRFNYKMRFCIDIIISIYIFLRKWEIYL